MSEEQKENIYKNKLPKKTKIAVWWLRLIGLASIIVFFIFMLLSVPGNSAPFVVFICSIFYFVLGLSLSIKSQWAWTVIVLLLAILSIFSIGFWTYIAIDDALHAFGMLLISSILYLTPLTLLIIDRKNYFEMVRQSNLAKEKEKGNP